MGKKGLIGTYFLGLAALFKFCFRLFFFDRFHRGAAADYIAFFAATNIFHQDDKPTFITLVFFAFLFYQKFHLLENAYIYIWFWVSIIVLMILFALPWSFDASIIPVSTAHASSDVHLYLFIIAVPLGRCVGFGSSRKCN